jgi:tetratricopeptide (TPR) repeat protein
VVEKLKAEPHILILDNLESVTGKRLAIKNTLSKNKRQEIQGFLTQLVGGKTRVVLGSRSGEDWLQGMFRENVYGLQGLDIEARSLLAERILERYVAASEIPKIRQDEEFGRLMKLLAGYPLAMEVVLANLKQQSPGEILQGLERADIALDSGSGDKTESIVQCVEYSHRNLSVEAQQVLLCLAPFSGFIDRDDIPKYVEELQKLEPFRDYRFEKFDGAIQDAINWGLLSNLSPSPSPPRRGGQDEEILLTIQPVFPYFLRTKLGTLNEVTREALQEGFKNHYLGLAGYYQRLMESKEAQERQIGILLCQLEYENLYNALKICLEQQETVDIFFCLDKYFELINDIQSRLKLSEFVCQAQEAYPSELRTGEIGIEIALALERIAYCYLETKNYQKASVSYHKILQLYQELSDVEERQKQLWCATIYHHLGIVAQELGRVAQESREWEQAKAYYTQALDIKIEFSDRYSQAGTYHNLGVVAQELREWEQAKAYYTQALDICIEFSDRFSQASTYHQLGIVAQELREWEQAKAYYKKALDIFIEYRDRYNQASTYGQLGLLAEAQEDYAEARANFQTALEIYIEYQDEYMAGVAREVLERLPELG